jgi:hypothetical protein
LAHDSTVRTAQDLPDGLRELIVEGRLAWESRDYPRARCLFEQALERAVAEDETFGQMSAYHFLGNVAFNECRDAESRELHLAALALSESENDQHGIATSLGSIALVDVAEGDLRAARVNYDASVAAYERAGLPEVASVFA